MGGDTHGGTAGTRAGTRRAAGGGERREREAQRDAWVQAHEANPPKSRPSDARNEGWWAERKAGATYTSIAKREKISVTTVTVGVWRIQCLKLWAWRHPTDETVIQGRTMLDDEDGR